MLTEFNPRKSKYGFKTHISSYNMLDVSEFILETLGKPQNDENWWLDLNTNMGASELKMYVNDPVAYDKMVTALARRANV